jgi:hypothetical protein
MKKLLILIILVYAGIAFSAEQRAEIKGITTGISEASLLEKYPHFTCDLTTLGMPPQKDACFLFVSTAETEECKTFLISESKRTPEQKECVSGVKKKYSFGDAPVGAYEVRFKEGKLGLASFSFGVAFYESVKAALTEKYGKPTEDKNETTQNRMGAEFDNNTCVWKIGNDTIEIKKRSAKIDTSSVRLFSDWFRDATANQIKENAKENAKNL